jgi:hypothetical protein
MGAFFHVGSSDSRISWWLQRGCNADLHRPTYRQRWVAAQIAGRSVASALSCPPEGGQDMEGRRSMIDDLQMVGNRCDFCGACRWLWRGEQRPPMCGCCGYPHHPSPAPHWLVERWQQQDMLDMQQAADD